MTKQEFVDAVADKAGLSKRDAGAAVDACLGVIESTLQNGDSVAFTGFGKFHVTRRAARQTAGHPGVEGTRTRISGARS